MVFGASGGFCVAGRAAGANIIRLLDVGLHLLLGRRIVLCASRAILCQRIIRRGKKAGEIPA